MKFNERYSVSSLSSSGLPVSSGRIFFTEKGVVDLSSVEVVGAFVDTVRQLFYGLPKESFVERLEQSISGGEDFFFLSAPPVNGLSGQVVRFHLSRMGKVSRYRYKLQNNELGLVILFGSYHDLMTNPNQHLKIELSPHFINSRTSAAVMAYLSFISAQLLVDYSAKGCAVHLACDYQNYSLPVDFLDRFSTHSRTIKTYDGVSSIDLSGLSESVTTYGSVNQERNYLIGKHQSVQLAIYDKSLEVIKSDKQDYFNHEWGVFSMGVHDPEKVTRRIELRFHHTVIREIGQGMGLALESFDKVVDYLTDIWRYGLKINRLKVSSTSDYFHPFWQFLMQDIEFTVPAQNIDVKRKKKDSVDPVARNISMLIGNLITLLARKGFNASQVMTQLRVLSVYSEIIDYYRSRGLNESDLRQAVEKGLALRRLIGKAA